MATFAADSERMIALELKKRTVALNASLAPLLQSIVAWTLNGLDPALPTPFEVRVAIEQYQALRLERLRQDDLISLFLTAKLGDTLTYPTPPDTTSLFDGSARFDGSTTFDGATT